MNESDFICDHHENIIKQAEDILHVKNDIEFFVNKIIKEKSKNQDDIDLPEWKQNYEEKEILDSIKDLEIYAKEILKSAKIALKQGQNMEDRLKDYRESIENLGFTRNKSK